MKKAEEILDKHLELRSWTNTVPKYGNLYNTLLDAVNEALNIPVVSKRYYHEVCGKGTLIKEYEHSVYGTMLMVKPLNKKDIYFAPKREFTELPFS